MFCMCLYPFPVLLARHIPFQCFSAEIYNSNCSSYECSQACESVGVHFPCLPQRLKKRREPMYSNAVLFTAWAHKARTDLKPSLLESFTTFSLAKRYTGIGSAAPKAFHETSGTWNEWHFDTKVSCKSYPRCKRCELHVNKKNQLSHFCRSKTVFPTWQWTIQSWQPQLSSESDSSEM